MASEWPARIAGGAAGLANGLFGGGGGMVFLPIVSRWGGLDARKLYATCVGVIFPVCAVSAAVYLWRGEIRIQDALPYLAVHGGAEMAVCRVPLLRGGEVPVVMDWLIPFLCGMGAAVISAWGVGGGTLLLLVMTLFLGVDQRTAQGINLLFFLPAALSALICHWKNGCLDRPTLKNAVSAAVPAALLGAWIATAVDVELLGRPFGAYLLLSGISLILPQKRKKESGS